MATHPPTPDRGLLTGLGPEDWARIFRAGRQKVLYFDNPNPRVVMGDALTAMADECAVIHAERATQGGSHDRG